MTKTPGNQIKSEIQENNKQRLNQSTLRHQRNSIGITLTLRMHGHKRDTEQNLVLNQYRHIQLRISNQGVEQGVDTLPPLQLGLIPGNGQNTVKTQNFGIHRHATLTGQPDRGINFQPERRPSRCHNTRQTVLHCNIIWPQTTAQTRQLFDTQTTAQALARLGKLQTIKGSPCRHKP